MSLNKSSKHFYDYNNVANTNDVENSTLVIKKFK
jgi:hypothetical protein